MALLLGALLLSPSCAEQRAPAVVGGLPAAEEMRSLEQVVVEGARTPGDHAALAEHYRAKAEKARAAMRRHESMARAYGRRKRWPGVASTHCKRLAERYGAMASEYEELAELHEAEAEKAP